MTRDDFSDAEQDAEAEAEVTSAAGKTLGRGPGFWGACMGVSYALIGGLAVSGALSDITVLLLMILPLGLIVPFLRSANALVDSGGDACFAKGAAQKRYLKRIAISTSFYMLSMGGLVYTANADGVAFFWIVLTSLAPGLAMLGVFWAIGRLIVEERDEFLRMLIIRQSLIATGIALSAASIWGFLEVGDVVPHADAYWWPVIWFGGLAVGALVNRIEYGAWGAV